MHSLPLDPDPPGNRPHDDNLDEADEYELEPVDPEVLQKERQRVEARVDAATTNIDIDELYREAARQRDWELSDFAIRFSVNHLLMATAALAVFFSLIPVLGICTALVLAASLIATSLAAVMSIQEQRRKREFYARVRQKLQGAPKSASAEAASIQPTNQPETDASADDPWHEPFREAVFSFSIREMMLAMTASAIFFAIITQLNPQGLGLALGFLAMAGLAAHAAGFEPPRVIVLGWWFILTFYVMLSLLTLAGVVARA